MQLGDTSFNPRVFLVDGDISRKLQERRLLAAVLGLPWPIGEGISVSSKLMKLTNA
jgi:hypothetical protein